MLEELLTAALLAFPSLHLVSNRSFSLSEIEDNFL